MKKTSLFLVAVLIAMIGFSMAGCDFGEPPVIVTTALIDGTVGAEYNRPVQATGKSPITWSLAGGELPAGLTLSESGAITGTPTAAGTSDFTVRAENSGGSDTKQLSITIRNRDTFAITNLTQWNSAIADLNGQTGEYTLTISGNIGVSGYNETDATFNRIPSFGTTADGSSLKVTLKGNGKLYLTSKGSLITVGKNQTLVIDSAGLTLQGLTSGVNSATEDNDAATVHVNGTLELKAGTISGNKGRSGVNVDYNITNFDPETYKFDYLPGGTFTMSGGEISGNKATGQFNTASGVSVGALATFNMTGGKITGNDGIGGGVYMSTSESSFNMSGGEISGNSTWGNRDNYAYGGGGVFVQGTFTMTSGKIINNDARRGGGVYMYGGTFIMNNGEISGNKADYYGGGGVYVSNDATFTMNNGKISKNSAPSTSPGGGVFVQTGGTFTMNNGAISGNTATTNSGGVKVDGTFIMKGGRISGNSATGAQGDGGGLYVTGTFQIFNGTIYGSEATGKDDDNIDLKNTAYSTSSGAALYKTSGGTAQYGTFTGEDDAWVGTDLPLSGSGSGYTSVTITVEEGVLK